MGLREILSILTIILASVMIVLTVLRLKPIISMMLKSRSIFRWDQPMVRVSSTIKEVFGHKTLMRNRLAGIIHLFIFSGFCILLLDIVEVLGQVFFSPSFSLPFVLQVMIDIWVLIVLSGVILAFYQRRVLRPKRFEGSDGSDAEIILVLISIIVMGIILHTSFFQLIAESVYGLEQFDDGHFLGTMFAVLWKAIGLDDPTIASLGYAIGYFMDIGVILYFMAYLPKSKHLHVLFAAPAIFFRKLDSPGQLASEKNTIQKISEINQYQDFTWKDILDLYTCTECGRCQDVCPAYASGSPLSPKTLIINLRDGLNKQLQDNQKARTKTKVPIAGNIISEETLWSCTTCGACEEACPVFIEHVSKIVGLRATLVEHGTVEERAQQAMEQLIETGNAYGESRALRPAWVSKLDYKFKDARKESVDWLWFLGDVVSFDTDPGVFESVSSLTTLLKRANLEVGLLFEGESSAGNDILRLGEMGLFEALAKQNISVLKEANFKRIFTSDPHSYNALANDYQKFYFNKPVFHYSQMLLDLLNEEKLTVHQSLGIRATYHDPCYLGRWNHIYEQPREVLRRCGVELVEMPRNRMESFCCGAGGGRMWMNESGLEERPSESRIREALELPGVTHFIVSCPKDMVMYTAAVESLGYQDRIKVVDMAQLVAIATDSEIIREQAV